MIDPKLALEALEKLNKEIFTSENHIDKLKVYSAIKTICDDLKAYTETYKDELAYIEIERHIDTIISNTESMAKLSTGGYEEDSESFKWNNAAISALESGTCFDT